MNTKTAFNGAHGSAARMRRSVVVVSAVGLLSLAGAANSVWAQAGSGGAGAGTPGTAGNAGAASTGGAAPQAQAQTSTPTAAAAALPRAILLFPVVLDTGGGADAGAGAAAGTPAAGAAATTQNPASPQRQLQDAVTEALRRSLIKNGVSVTVYSERLPSIQRAISETVIKREEAAAGLRDDSDTARAQRFANLIGAPAYVVPTVSDYKYDPATRTATFNLSTSYVAAGTGASLGLAAAPGKGEAPADVANSLQEGSATARGAEAAAERVATDLFPRPVVVEAPKKNDRRR